MINHDKLASLILDNNQIVFEMEEQLSQGYTVKQSLIKSTRWGLSPIDRLIFKQIDYDLLASLVSGDVHPDRYKTRRNSMRKGEDDWYDTMRTKKHRRVSSS